MKIQTRETFTLTAFSELRDTLAQDLSSNRWRKARELSEKISNALDTGELLDALREAASVRNSSELLSEVLSVLAEPDHDHLYTNASPTKVVFSTYDYDNGFFLHDDGVVHYADGETQQIEFGNMINELLTEGYGTVGPDATLTIHLQAPHTGDTEFEE
jgi:hypothetical protein